MSPFVPLQPSSLPSFNSIPMAQALPHSIMYTAGQPEVHYMPQYYSTPYAHYAPSSYPDRTLKAERRRPKYTRSKTGCLTCRKKKVKCDETKPSCHRCSNSQLTCTWPEVPPPKKKMPSRKERSCADQSYSTTTSEAGTSSLSPSDMGELDGTPQPSFKSEAPSPEIGQGEGAHASVQPQALYTDPNMLQVGSGWVNDRRHSEPHLVPLATSAIETRRHSMADIMDGQQYAHQQQEHFQNHDVSSGNGALGLTLNQLAHGGGSAANTRPSTPSDYLYQSAGGGAPTSSGFVGYSPSGHIAIIPNISNGSTSSRPSTAASSLSLSQSFRRTSASSRPSTAGSHIGAGSGASMTSHHHQYQHRPASSGAAAPPGGSSSDYHHPSLGYSPFSFQLSRNPGDVSLDAVNANTNMNGAMGSVYANACISRPSTASSAPSTHASPYMRHGTVPLDGSAGVGVGVGVDRWHASPMLAQPQPHVLDGSGVSNYLQHVMHSTPPHHARTDSPAWAC